MAGRHVLTPEDRAKGQAAARAVNYERAQARRVAEFWGAVERARLGTHPDAPARRARAKEIAAALDTAGYRTTINDTAMRVGRGQYASGRKYMVLDYTVVLNDGNTIYGQIRGLYSSRLDLERAIFKKEGMEAFGYEDVAAIITGDTGLSG